MGNGASSGNSKHKPKPAAVAHVGPPVTKKKPAIASSQAKLVQQVPLVVITAPSPGPDASQETQKEHGSSGDKSQIQMDKEQEQKIQRAIEQEKKRREEADRELQKIEVTATASQVYRLDCGLILRALVLLDSVHFYVKNTSPSRCFSVRIKFRKLVNMEQLTCTETTQLPFIAEPSREEIHSTFKLLNSDQSWSFDYKFQIEETYSRDKERRLLLGLGTILFEDDQFSATLNSVGMDGQYSWLRPYQFLCGRPFTVIETADIDDIKQGSLDNCWLLSALASIAAHSPKYITEQLLVDSHTQKDGRYRVKFFKDGAERIVTIDDRMPCITSTGKPAFGQPSGASGGKAEIWTMLIEKAFAKLHGCYGQLNYGKSYEAFEDLLGMPATYLMIEHPQHAGTKRSRASSLTSSSRPTTAQNNAVTPDAPPQPNKPRFVQVSGAELTTDAGWKRLIDSARAGNLIAATCGKNSAGLHGDHVYTVLDLMEHPTSGIKLIKLRNPWSSGEWQGDWSDHSPLWNDESRQFFKSSSDDDGIFFMNLDDFMQNFTSVHIGVPWNKNWKQIRMSGTLVSAKNSRALVQVVRANCNSYLLTVSKPTKLILGLHQTDPRVKNAPAPMPIGVIVLSKDTGTFPFSVPLSKRRSSYAGGDMQMVDVQPGQYLLYPYGVSVDQKPNEYFVPRNYCLVVQSLDPDIMLQEAQAPTNLNKLICEYVFSKGSSSQDQMWVSQENGTVLVCIRNTTAGRLRTILEAKLQNMASTAGNAHCEAVLAPNRMEVLACLHQTNPSKGWSWTWSGSWKACL